MHIFHNPHKTTIIFIESNTSWLAPTEAIPAEDELSPKAHDKTGQDCIYFIKF
jgi:hypothetical protein